MMIGWNKAENWKDGSVKLAFDGKFCLAAQGIADICHVIGEGKIQQQLIGGDFAGRMLPLTVSWN